MKARIFRVFKDVKHTINYVYVDVPKCHDDVESVNHGTICTPMMEIRVFREDGSLCEECMCTYATPEIIKAYTGFDLFNADYSFSIYDRGLGVIDIEFEWETCNYPYIDIYHHKDRVLTDKIQVPVINKIENIPLFELID